ncbi:signal peptidase I [Paramicrobacterium sp. CJ85]|uniref:signal peptidase I n=1 Tax=Paramicrobacterium sp. CJ85 TaxID=3445355 RepID=UPI003F61A16F
MTGSAPGPAPSGVSSGVQRVSRSFWFNLITAFVVLALIQGFVVKLYYVPSESMEGTLHIGDRVLVSRLSYIGSAPTTQDIIVFNASDAWDDEANLPKNPLQLAIEWLGGVVGIGPSLNHTLVKRVIAGPGQSVSCCGDNGEMMVDGKPLAEPYVVNDFEFIPGELDCSTTPISRRCVKEFTVPDDEYVVLGDNRTRSSDSLFLCRGLQELGSCVRTVKRSDIVGKLFITLLPTSDFGRPDS